MRVFEVKQSTKPSRSAEIAEQLQRLDPISLSEMDGVSLMNRVDTKYLFGEDDLVELLRRVRPEYRVLQIDGDRAFGYRTLYFDTPGRRCYLQHHNGKLNRLKYRIRQYQSSGRCFLEVKRKNSKGRTDKRRMVIPAIEETLSPEHQAFIRESTGDLPNLRPEMWTCFSRLTLVHHTRAERVTIDRALSFRGGSRDRGIPGLVIAEVKQERDDRSSPLRQELRALRVRPMRVSKFCLGSMLLDPGLKYNRFKPKLMAINKVI